MMSLSFRSAVVFLVLGGFLLGGCSGPSKTGSGGDEPSASDADTRADEAEEEEERVQRASVAKYETFDASAYPVEPPARSGGEVTHEVPSRLMEGRADEGTEQTLDGFRIQVFSAQDQEAAQNFREKVRRWWKTVKNDEDTPMDLFRSEPPIVIEYSQPYYRVRIGAFAKRDEAEEALQFVKQTYSGAFVAQSTVTVVR